MVDILSDNTISMACVPVACVSLMTLLAICFSVAFRLSTRPICSGLSNPAGLFPIPFRAIVCANIPRLCRPLSTEMFFGHPNGLTHPLTNASRHAELLGTPLVSPSRRSSSKRSSGSASTAAPSSRPNLEHRDGARAPHPPRPRAAARTGRLPPPPSM